MLAADNEPLIDSIYEAAALPERWPQVLTDLSGMAGAVGATLHTVLGGTYRFAASPSLLSLTEDFLAGDWPNHNKRGEKLVAARHAGFLREDDVMTDEEYRTDHLIQNFLRPRGFGYSTATAFEIPPGDMLIVSIDRQWIKGPVEREIILALDRLRPHLGRAALISARLHLEQARAAVAALDVIGLPAAVINAANRVVAANTGLSTMMPRRVLDARERIRFADRNADAMLALALARSSLQAGLGGGRSIPIAAMEEEPALVAHLAPVRGDARDIFGAGSHLIVMTTVGSTSIAEAGVIQALFDLTAAEARVAQGIAAGKTIAELAANFRVAPATIRVQLRSIFEKTGLSRQADLVRLLSGLALRG